jgi:hypothetical protein
VTLAVTAPAPRLTISNEVAVNSSPVKTHGSELNCDAFSGAGGPRPSKPTKGLQPEAAPQPPGQLVWQKSRPVCVQPVSRPQLMVLVVLPAPV